MKQGWYDFRTFNIKEYEKYERVDQGDLNWIIPGKFVAFMGPVSHRDPGQRVGFTPEEYAQIFDAWKVTKVVRLNDERYERKRFIRLGIDH